MEKILIMADLHGSWKPVRDLYKRNSDILNNQNSILILLGDTGLNFFFNHRDEEFKKKLSKFPFTYFVVRGNHEERPSICAEKNPDKWHQEPMWGGNVWVENDYPYIKYAMDYVTMYFIPYKNEKNERCTPFIAKTLVIPGAYSVDKYKRLQAGWSWFPQEQLSESEKLVGKNLIEAFDWKCDLVLSHTCPIIYEPIDLFLSVVDQSIVDKGMERYLGEIENKLDYKVWMWGHYHQFRGCPREIGVPYPENPRRLMLFNDYAVEMSDIMNSENLIKRL